MTRRFLGIPMLGWAAAFVAGCSSFVVTLVLTAPTVGDITLLVESKVTDERDLNDALKRTGLKASGSVRGFIDQLQRVDPLRVRVTGWAAQTDGSGSPLTVIMFSGGRSFIGQTSGPRGDVANALRLGASASRNVAFDLSIRCNSGDVVLASAVTSESTFGRIRYGAQQRAACP